MKVEAPEWMCLRVSQRAVQLANETMKGFGWSNESLQALTPMPSTGRAGMRSTAKYIIHQDRGIRPFVMNWVEGRVIPLSCPSGDGPHLRTGKNPGQPGWVNIPHVGRVWREQKWRHPGLAPRNFMENALTQSVEEIKPLAKEMLKQGLMGRDKTRTT